MSALGQFQTSPAQRGSAKTGVRRAGEQGDLLRGKKGTKIEWRVGAKADVVQLAVEVDVWVGTDMSVRHKFLEHA